MKKLVIILTIFASINFIYLQNLVNAQEATNPYCFKNEEDRQKDRSFNPFGEHSKELVSGATWSTAGKDLDPDRPQLKGLTGSTPNLVAAYTFTPKEGESTEEWKVSQAVGIGVSAGQSIYVPPSGRTIGSGMQVLVSNLNATAGTISLQYTLDAGFSNASGGAVNRYDLHLNGVQITPELVNLFNSRTDGKLPALPAGYILGKATSTELLVSMADTGSFMNLLEQNDFWAGDVNVNPVTNLMLLDYIKCPVAYPPAQSYTCQKPMLGADNYSCLAGCTGITYTSFNIFESLRALFTQNYEIPVKLADGEFKGQISDYRNPSNVELYSNNTTPTAYILGRVDYVDDPNKFWTETKTGVKYENPPTYNTSLANFITPDMNHDEAYYRNAFKDKMEETSQVQILIKNAADVTGEGFQAEGLVPIRDRAKDAGLVGARVVPAKNCTSGCWVPEIKLCKPGRDFDCGGGGVAVYVQNDPLGPGANTTLSWGWGAIDFGPKNEQPIYGKGYSVYKGTTQGPDANSAIVNNVGHDCVENDGTVSGRSHCGVNINWKWCTKGAAACYSEFGTPPVQNGVPDKSGGPIVTSQPRLAATREIVGRELQGFMAPPGVIYADSSIPGVAKEDIYSKEVLALREKYKEEIQKSELAQNLSENEKIDKIFKQVALDQKMHSQRQLAYTDSKEITDKLVDTQKQQALKKVEEFRDKELANTQTNNIEKTVFFVPDNQCPQNLNINKAPICPNDTVQKPNTTIYLPPKTISVGCPGGDCTKLGKPSEEEHDASALVFTALSSGENVTAGTGFTRSIYTADAIDRAMSTYSSTENIVKMSLGNQNLFQGIILKIFRTPQEGPSEDDRFRDINFTKAAPRPFGLIFDVSFWQKLFSDLIVANKWEEPDEGSSIGCQKLLKILALTPEDKQGKKDLEDNTINCIKGKDQNTLPDDISKIANYIGRTGYYSYTFTDADYFSKTPLDTPISGRAKYYSYGYGENMENTYAYRVADKTICPDCDGYAAMLRAGDKGRIVCISKGSKTYRAQVIDVAARGDIPGLLDPSNNWVIDVSHGLAVKLGMVAGPGVDGGGPTDVVVSECN